MQKIILLILVILTSCATTGESETGTHGSSNRTIPRPQASGQADLTYHLSIPNPASHDIEVSILVENHNDRFVEFVMPTWAPRRLIRDDFAALVSRVNARGRGAKTLSINRVGANRWRIRAGGEDFVFKYRVHSPRLSNGTSLVNDQGGILHPGSICMYVEGRRDQSLSVYLGLPETLKWSSYCSLDALDRPNSYKASSYGSFIHAPIHLGSYSEHQVTIDGQVAQIIVSPQSSTYSNQVAQGVEELLKKSHRYFGPNKKKEDLLVAFSFGLGHGQSCEAAGAHSMSIGQADAISERSVRVALQSFANLTTQVHLNKVLQPVDWNQVDFDRLLVDPMAWLPEALGKYFGLHLMQRCGLMGEQQLLASLAQVINRVESEPAKRLMTLQEAATNMALRQDSLGQFASSNQRNQFFDATDRGLVVLLLLDLATIRDSEGERDLSALLPFLLRQRNRIDEKTFLLACQEVGSRGVGILANNLLNDTAVRPYKEIARESGFVIDADAGSHSQFGAQLRGTKIVSVASNGAAARAGLQLGDRVIRFAGKNASKTLNREIRLFPSGSPTTITVERRGSLVTLPIRLAEIRRGKFRFTLGDSSMKNLRDRFFGNIEQP